MKPRVLKSLVGMLAVCLACGTAMLSAQTASVSDKDATPPPLGVATPTPSATAADTPTGKKNKKPRNPNDPTPTPKPRKKHEIAFPVPIGRSAFGAKIPNYDAMGKLLSVLESAKMTHIDDEHVRMTEMKFDMNEGNGKDEYHVIMPTCVLDLKTNIITSDQPVIIRTKDFELTGEKVQFNTVEQTGELQGHVHMVIHNFKSVVTPGQPAPET